MPKNPNIPDYYRSLEWHETRRYILKRDHDLCQYCGNKAVTADHVIPRKKGGSDDPENLVAVCEACNRLAKGKHFRNFQEKNRWMVWTRSDPANHPDVVRSEPKYTKHGVRM